MRALIYFILFTAALSASAADIDTILQQQGLAAADSAFRQARSDGTSNNATLADNAISIGRAAMADGELDLALQYFSDAVLLAPDNGDALLGAGAALVSKQDFERATTYFDNARRLAEKNKDDLLLAEALNALSAVKRYQDDNEAAIPLLEQAVAADERVLGTGHADIALRYFHLGQLYQSVGRIEDAMKQYRAAIGAAKDNKDEMAGYAGALGTLQLQRRQYAAAIASLTTAIDTATPLNNNNTIAAVLAAWHKQRASAHAAERRFDTAITDINAAIDITSKADGDTAIALSLLHNDLGTLYLQTNRYRDAEAALQKAITTQTQRLSATHPALLDSRSKLVGAYFAQQRFDDAAKILESLLRLPNDMVTPLLSAGWRMNLATVYARQQRIDEADALYQRAIADLSQAVGDDHAYTLNARQSYETFKKNHKK